MACGLPLAVGEKPVLLSHKYSDSHLTEKRKY